MNPYELTLIGGHDTGRCLRVSRASEWTICRSSECDFQLHDLSVSRKHFCVAEQTQRLVVRDLASRWGTFVNGVAVGEKVVGVGDRILAGETEFLVTSADAGLQSTRFPISGQTVLPRRVPATRDWDAERIPRRSRIVFESRLTSDNDVLRLLGSTYLHYEVQSIVATARTGAIFRALDTLTGQTVALKVFWPHLFLKEAELARFVRAMRKAIPIDNEHLVRVFNAGRHRGTCFTACELVEGESVANLIQRIGVCGMLDWRRVLLSELERVARYENIPSRDHL